MYASLINYEYNCFKVVKSNYFPWWQIITVEWYFVFPLWSVKQSTWHFRFVSCYSIHTSLTNSMVVLFITDRFSQPIDSVPLLLLLLSRIFFLFWYFLYFFPRNCFYFEKLFTLAGIQIFLRRLKGSYQIHGGPLNRYKCTEKTRIWSSSYALSGSNL